MLGRFARMCGFGRSARVVMVAMPATVVALLAFTADSQAQFTVCNQTLDVVNVAIGHQVDEDFRTEDAEATFQTEGWWTVGANQCADVIRDELSTRYVYVYADDIFGQSILTGSVEMCVGSKRFEIRGTESCWQRGYRAAPFHEVDTLATERWTLFLSGAGN